MAADCDTHGPDPTAWAENVKLIFKDTKTPVEATCARIIFKDVIGIADPRLHAEKDPAQQALWQKATIDVWIAYADMESRLRQFKAAANVYIQATANDAVRTSRRFWMSYLMFLAGNGLRISDRMHEIYMVFWNSIKLPVVCSSASLQSTGGEKQFRYYPCKP